MINGSILQENIKIFNVICKYPTTMSKHIRHKLIEVLGEINKSIIMVRDFNTSLLEMGKSRRQKISKDMVEFNSALNQMDIIDISELIYLMTADYIFFTHSRGTFTNIDHILNHKIHLKLK